jgi:hypothetical protein
MYFAFDLEIPFVDREEEKMLARKSATRACTEGQSPETLRTVIPRQND